LPNSADENNPKRRAICKSNNWETIHEIEHA
jgi:hypothetical protein